MANKPYKPVTPARRGMLKRDSSAITKKRPTKSLTTRQPAITGRNAQGKITVRHRGGGAKRLYRLVAFKNLPAEVKVLAIEYDPNRSANIALVEATDGKRYYVLAGAKMKVGQVLRTGPKATVKTGNRTQLKNIQTGSSLYSIELNKGKGGQLARAAGASARLAAKDGNFAHVRLPSGEVRLIQLNAYATMGSVGNESHQHIKWGSAGRRRRMGFRPTVRGKAMNPVDHPHGGGEAHHTTGGHPRTPWGKMALGKKTRTNKQTGKYIVRTRKQSKRK